MDRIEFDFGGTMRQVRQLEDIADKLRKISEQKIASAMKELSYGWRSDNANCFQAKAEKLQANISMTAGNLEKTAGNIKRVAQNVYDAEMRAKELAAARKYKG